jgi:hypothetical protein
MEHPMSLKDRHLFGVGAAACAMCCAAPLLTPLGVAGAAATVATFVFAGLVFGLVMAAGTLVAVWQQRRRRGDTACAPTQPPEGAIDLALTAARDRREA